MSFVLSFGQILLLSVIGVDLSFVNIPVQYSDDYNGTQVGCIATAIQTAQTTSRLVDTLNSIPYHFNVTHLLSTNQIQHIYQNALLRTIQLDVRQIFYVMNIILNQNIPKHYINNYVLLSILNKAITFMEENNIIPNYKAFHLMWEQILLHTLHRNYPIYIDRSKKLFALIQNVLFTETETSYLWTNELISIHLELLILMHYNEPAILNTSFEKMLRMGILEIWSYQQITPKQMVLNIKQYKHIHIMWIVKWAIQLASKHSEIETIAIDATQDQKTFILNHVFKGLIQDKGGVFLILSMIDTPQLKLDLSDLMTESLQSRT